MQKLLIIRAIPKDVELITKLLNQSFQADVDNYGYEVPSYNRPHEKTLEMINFGHTYIGYLDDVAVTSVSIMPDDREGVYEIKGLVTLPELQGKGFGRQMMDFCHNAINAQIFTLTTPIDKESNVEFYKSFGYEVVGDFVEFGNSIYVFEKKII